MYNLSQEAHWREYTYVWEWNKLFDFVVNWHFPLNQIRTKRGFILGCRYRRGKGHLIISKTLNCVRLLVMYISVGSVSQSTKITIHSFSARKKPFMWKMRHWNSIFTHYAETFHIVTDSHSWHVFYLWSIKNSMKSTHSNIKMLICASCLFPHTKICCMANALKLANLSII